MLLSTEEVSEIDSLKSRFSLSLCGDPGEPSALPDSWVSRALTSPLLGWQPRELRLRPLLSCFPFENEAGIEGFRGLGGFSLSLFLVPFETRLL